MHDFSLCLGSFWAVAAPPLVCVLGGESGGDGDEGAHKGVQEGMFGWWLLVVVDSSFLHLFQASPLTLPLYGFSHHGRLIFKDGSDGWVRGRCVYVCVHLCSSPSSSPLQGCVGVPCKCLFLCSNEVLVSLCSIVECGGCCGCIFQVWLLFEFMVCVRESGRNSFSWENKIESQRRGEKLMQRKRRSGRKGESVWFMCVSLFN